jgi:hypothetical protein
MTLIVEDGTGSATAQSYCSTAFADAYHRARANDDWLSLGTQDKEAALIRATDHIGQAYGQRWKGVRVSAGQALDWPRYGVVANGFAVDLATVPVAIANATAELALRASRGALAPDVGRIKTKVKVGPIETEYAGGSGLTRFTAVDNLLGAYLGSSGSMIPLRRA